MAAGFGTGFVIGWLVGALVAFLLRKSLNKLVQGAGGELGTYFKDPKTGKVTQQAFPAFYGPHVFEY